MSGASGASGGGAPALNIIQGVFEGVSMAVQDVAGVVNNHTDRLANNPCAWRNELASLRGRLSQRIASVAGTAQRLSTAGRIARNTAEDMAGFWGAGARWNPGSIMSFGKWLQNRGFTTGGFIPIPIPGLPGTPAPFLFVRRGAPRATAGGINLGTGAYLYPGNANGKLAGPAIWAEWVEWLDYMRETVQIYGRPYGPLGGWQGALSALVGSSDTFTGQFTAASKLGQLHVRVGIVDAMIADATAACGSGGDGGGGGGGTSGGGGALLLVALLALALRRKRR